MIPASRFFAPAQSASRFAPCRSLFPQQIGLCFRDAPGLYPSEDLLRTLREENVRATFFCSGDNLNNSPEAALRLLKDGHEIGNHTQSCRPLSTLEDLDEIWEEIVRCQHVVWELTGREPRLFYAPESAHDERVSEVLHELSLLHIESDLNDCDWNESIPNLRNRLLRRIRAGHILSLGLRNPAHPGLLREILQGLRHLGLQVVPVSQLLTASQEPLNAPLLFSEEESITRIA